MAARPKTLFAAVAPIILGTALAINDTSFHLFSFLICLICSILIQIATNMINDLYDGLKGTDDKNRLGPTRVTSNGLISPNKLKLVIIILFTVTFLLGLILVYRAGTIILIIGILSLISGYAYTGGPYPLAYNGLGDIFVLVFFGIVATVGTYFVQTLNYSHNILLYSFIPGLLITNILVINNYRDYESDRKHSKNTLIVKFGLKFGFIQYIVQNIICFIILAIQFYFTNNYYLFLSLLLLPMLLKNIKNLKLMQGKEFNNLLADTSKYAFLFCLILSISLIL